MRSSNTFPTKSHHRRLRLFPLLFAVVLPLIVANLIGVSPAQAVTGGGISGLTVSVAYAEDVGDIGAVPPSFPVPWNGAPNTTFLGSPDPLTAECGAVPAAQCYDTGAIRFDNTGSSPQTVSNLSVNIRASSPGGKLYKLWSTFTVDPGKSVILAENPPGDKSKYDDFDSSDTPQSNCTPQATPPAVTLTVGGATTTLLDNQHILDTGGVDSGWCPHHENESIQWQRIDAATRNQAASLKLNPSAATGNAGQTITETATLLDGSGFPLPNTGINFDIVSGPDAGKAESAFTDANGNATFAITGGTAEGVDAVVASAGFVGSFQSNTTDVMWNGGTVPGCSAPWSCADIGSPRTAGNASVSGTTWTINGAGSDIHGSSDQFQFVSKPLAGDGSVSAQVISQTNTSPWAKAGVMMRASLDPGSPDYDLLVTPGNGIIVQDRLTQGGTTSRFSTVTGTVPKFLKVTRSGTTFSAYTSPDGAAWTLMPKSTATIGTMAGSLFEGLAVTSHNSSALCTVTMDSVQAT